MLSSIDRWSDHDVSVSKPYQELYKRWFHPFGIAVMGGIAFFLSLAGWHAAISTPVLFLAWWALVRISDVFYGFPFLSGVFPLLLTTVFFLSLLRKANL